MTKEQYIKQCLMDALSALQSRDSLPTIIQVGRDYIYPTVAVNRIKAVLNVDKLTHFAD